jgi:adenylyltransferase/sulfurtransferase
VENETAALPGSHLIPLGELPTRADEIAAQRAVVVYCHHGVRSRSGAAYLARSDGATSLLAGGIDAWSTLVDPKVSRY